MISIQFIPVANLQPIIKNRTTDAGNFAPWLEGNTDDDAYLALELSGRVNFSGANTGSVPVVVFDARYSTEATALVRPLFRWRSNTQTSLMQMDANGNLGIGTTTPSEKLHVAGKTRINTISAGTGNDVGFDANGVLIDLTSSSMHFKENIEDLEFNQAGFMSMRPVSFNWKEVYGGSLDVGFIAQEVAESFAPLADIRFKHIYLPDGSVLRDSSGMAVIDSSQVEPYGVKYHKLPVYLFMLAKEQQSTIIELTERIDQLQTMVESCCSQPHYRVGDEPVETTPDRVGTLNEFVLLQNDPNPFADYTDIRVSLPETAKNASLLIVDMKGTVVRNIQLEGRSETVRVYSSDIGKGIFTYFLLNEGNVVASRKMVSSK
ncbi:MAG: hypothetical protein POELPBGB_01629 [Bacteroidia bacterium]|nr:hypothetical protein [Bacteroidia bacterium]